MEMHKFTKEELVADLMKKEAEVTNKPRSEEGVRLDELHFTTRQLRKMGYDCEMRGHDIINMIEQNHIDVSTLEFPQGDYESFKKAVDDGRYAFNDYDRSEMEITDEERQAIEDAVAAGLIFRIR